MADQETRPSPGNGGTTDASAARSAKGRRTSSASEATKRRLKAAAQQLFAERGFDGVTVQQIVSAAGQRNNASLHYHFGSKEELARQLVVDGARRVNDHRLAMLAELEANGGIDDLRQLMYALMQPVLSISEEPDQQSYARFIANLQASKRQLLRDAVGDQWNLGYRLCLQHIRRLLPALPPELLEQRLSLVGIYGNAALAAREAALHQRNERPDRLWGQSFALENYVDTMVATVTCPPSAQTLAQLDRDRTGQT